MQTPRPQPLSRPAALAQEQLDRIISHLKVGGEQLDLDIARALRLPLDVVRKNIEYLSANGDVMTCQVVRFQGGNKIEGLSCRMAGFIPPRTAGRKPGAPPA